MATCLLHLDFICCVLGGDVRQIAERLFIVVFVAVDKVRHALATIPSSKWRSRASRKVIAVEVARSFHRDAGGSNNGKLMWQWERSTRRIRSRSRSRSSTSSRSRM